ncbi:MAG TPA: hypothetical protein VLV83_11300 [Acidobacteriota bacterium]|nr:hypothetical protein [Acidobacteriota bacterium]
MKRISTHLALLWAFFAWLPAQEDAAPPAAADPNDLLNIQFQEDVRVFTVMAAINAAGFDYEKDGYQMSDLRQAVRAKLEERLDQEMKVRLSSGYEQYASVVSQGNQHVAFTSLALIVTGPPEFSLNMKEADMPGDTWRVRGFQALLPEFYKQAQIDKMWEEYRARYTTELAGYVPVLRRSIRETLGYFRIPLRVMVDRKIILIPDLLNAHEIVNARNLERTYYVVVGPTEDPSNNVRQLQHEYLHTLIDPLVGRQIEVLKQHRGLFEWAEAQPRMRPVIQSSYELMVIESLIEAIQLRMSDLSEEDLNRALVNLFREGLVLLPYFHRALADYEGNELLALPSYLDIIFQNIDPDEVAEDRKAIVRLEQEIEDLKQQREAEVEAKNEDVRRHNRRVALLRQAGELISQQKLQEAEATLATVIEEYPEESAALFYMAQVKSQSGLHDEAYNWYERTAQSQAEPWIKATSLVRMGRIDAARGRFEQARSRFQAALQIEGDVRGAHDEARQLLEKLPAQQ